MTESSAILLSLRSPGIGQALLLPACGWSIAPNWLLAGANAWGGGQEPGRRPLTCSANLGQEQFLQNRTA